MQQQSNIETLGRYKILQRLGHGGMGDVWLSEDPRLHRQVAIKTLPAHTQQDQEFVARFEHEAQAAAALNHPHILPIHDYGRQPSLNGSLITYIVMPYIKGGSLSERIAIYTQKQALMPIPEALAFLSQAAEAIDYAHEQQVIHRDIKPGNMLLRDANWLLLADFGIARILTAANRLTASGPGFGTPEYMAPEQAHGQAVISSDNYSLAVIAYQLFTGRLPFQADTSYAVTIQHLTMPPPPPRQFNPALSLAFEQALLQGLAKQPDARPVSARAFVETLQKAHAAASTEPTYHKTPADLVTNTFVRPADSQNTSAKDTLLADTITPNKTPLLLTRRRVLLGGSTAAALAVGAGLGIWKIASTATIQQPGSAKAPTTAIITRNPNAPTLVLTGHSYPAATLAWHPQKRILVSAGAQDDWMITWNIDTLLQHPHQSPLYMKRMYLTTGNIQPLTAWSSDGKYLVVVNNTTNSSEHKVSLDLYTLNAKTLIPEPTLSIPIPTQNLIDGMGWLHNKYIITVEQDNNNTQFLMRMVDITQPKVQSEPALFKNQSLASAINSSTTTNILAISPDNSTVAITLSDSSVLVGQASIAGNKIIWQAHARSLQSQAIGLASAAWSADNHKIITLADSELDFWNWQENNPQPQPLNISSLNSPLLFSSLVSNPASTTPCFATGTNTGQVSLWNATSGATPIKTLNNGGISGPVVAMAWSLDGRWLAASFGDVNASILLWKL